MNRYKEPVYTLYVRHAMRFYSHYPNITNFRSEADRLNWYACHSVIQGYSAVNKDILLSVYGERDTLGDNVYNVSKRYGIHQDGVWLMMREFERELAIERGLL